MQFLIKTKKRKRNDNIPVWAYQMADAMLVEREKNVFNESNKNN